MSGRHPTRVRILWREGGIQIVSTKLILGKSEIAFGTEGNGKNAAARRVLLPVPGGDDGPAAVGLGAQRHRLDRVDDGEEAVERHEDERVDAHVRRRDDQVLHQLAPETNACLLWQKIRKLRLVEQFPNETPFWMPKRSAASIKILTKHNPYYVRVVHNIVLFYVVSLIFYNNPLKN